MYATGLLQNYSWPDTLQLWSRRSKRSWLCARAPLLRVLRANVFLELLFLTASITLCLALRQYVKTYRHDMSFRYFIASEAISTAFYWACLL